MSTTNEPKLKKAFQGLDQLSLGLSIVIAILIGIGVGYALYLATQAIWTLWLGVFWGIAAAGLNIQKAYKKLKKELETPLTPQELNT